MAAELEDDGVDGFADEGEEVDGFHEEDGVDGTELVAPLTATKNFCPSFSKELYNRKKGSCKFKLVVNFDMCYKFYINTGQCHISASNDNGTVKLDYKACTSRIGHVTIFDMNHFVPSLSVNTHVISFQKTWSVITMKIRFVNQTGCQFKTWLVQVQGKICAAGQCINTGWKSIVYINLY